MTGSGLRAAGGIVAAGLALGVAELVSVPIDAGSAPLTAIGSTVVDRTPDRVREWAIDAFGTNDKLVLFAAMAVVAVAVAALAGRVEGSRRLLGSALFVVFGLVAAVAAVARPTASWAWVLPSVLGVALGIAALRWSTGRLEAAESASRSDYDSSPPPGKLPGPGVAGESAVGSRDPGVRPGETATRRGSTLQPKATGHEPEGAATRPEDTATQPEGADAQPDDAAGRPDDAAGRPDDAAGRPEAVVTRSGDAAVRTENAADQSRDTAAWSEDTADRPEDTVDRPEDTVDRSDDTAARGKDTAVVGGSGWDTRTPGGTPGALDRRQAVRGLVGIGVLAAVTGVAGRVLGARANSVSAEREAVRLPPPRAPEPPIDPAADLRIPGLTPYLTSNADFYRIDTALVVPQVSTEGWELRIHGMVEREIRLGYADLVRRPAVERLVTLACVSNPVGGDLVGNARWLGYRLDDLLAEAGPHPDANMVLSHSIDGFTAGSPLAALTDGRDALLAVGMNGEPLPVEHGYPARLVVPGLYGYVSATKWVTELEITRFDRAQAYWTKRGWSASGPIKIGTRIDTPRQGSRPGPGRITVAGVAWAQHRGISAVEVQIDSGPWQPARLAAEPSIDTWRQWTYDWDATPGPHILRARSTDGTGQVQTSEYRDVIPDGASGYPSAQVRVG